MDQATRQGDAATPGRDAEAPGWRIEVKEGPNQGAVVPLELGAFRIGTGLSNDIILADAAVADQQATLNVTGTTVILRSLASGVLVGGRPVAAGQAIAVPDGAVIHAGGTVMELRGPPGKRPWAIWAAGGVLGTLLLLTFASLVGLTSPSRSNMPPSHPPVAAAVGGASAVQAAAALSDRLREAGLADRVRLTPSAGTVVAEGALPGPDLVRWADQQMWFDSRYKGALSLVNRVREAAAEDRPQLQLRAVSAGSLAYIITSTGDRYVEGGVVDGWTIERIEEDRVVLTRGGRRVELRL